MFRVALLIRMVAFAFFGSRRRAAALRPKRWLLLLLLPGYLLLEIWTWICFALDEVLFPGHRRVSLKQPVFITGIPRSGTTFLHRLLSRDEETFTSFRTWEMIFAPSIVQKKLALALGAVDRWLGAPGKKLILRIENRVFQRLRSMHELGFFETEEDEILLLHRFSSIYLYLAFPHPDLMAYGFFDQRVDPRERLRAMAFYRRCLQKHLYQFGLHKHFLSKNPAFSAKFISLAAAFPDAMFLYPIRQPSRTIPSSLSLFHYLSQRCCTVQDVDSYQASTLAMLHHWHEHPLEVMGKWPTTSYQVIPFDELTSNPSQTVKSIYQRGQIPMRPTYEATLQSEEQRSRTYRSRHDYPRDWERHDSPESAEAQKSHSLHNADPELAARTKADQKAAFWRAYEALLRLANQ